MGVLYRIHEEPRATHLPNAPGLGAGAALTLCGWTDVGYDEFETDAQPSCVSCLRIVAYCRAWRS